MKGERRGVSEVVAALALIAITLAAMAIYVHGLYAYYSGEQGIISGLFTARTQQILERLAIIYVAQNSSGLFILISNYGPVNATIARLLIDADVYTSFEPRTIPSESLAVVHVPIVLPSGVHTLAIITERGNSLSAVIRL